MTCPSWVFASQAATFIQEAQGTLETINTDPSQLSKRLSRCDRSIKMAQSNLASYHAATRQQDQNLGPEDKTTMEKDEELYHPPGISELSVVLDQTIRDLEVARTEIEARWVQDTEPPDIPEIQTAGEEEGRELAEFE